MKLMSCLLAVSVFLGLPCFAGIKEKRSLKNQSKPHKASPTELMRLPWMSYEEANQRASETGKYVALFFTGSDWCIWCVRMQKEIFGKEEFEQFANKHLCMVEIDFPNKRPLPEASAEFNENLRERYDVNGFPTLVLVDSKGEMVLREGFRHGGAAAYVSYLKDALGLNKQLLES